MVFQILLVFAFVFFAIGAFLGPAPATPSPWYSRLNLLSLGLACWVLAELLTHWRS